MITLTIYLHMTTPTYHCSLIISFTANMCAVNGRIDYYRQNEKRKRKLILLKSLKLGKVWLAGLSFCCVSLNVCQWRNFSNFKKYSIQEEVSLQTSQANKQTNVLMRILAPYSDCLAQRTLYQYIQSLYQRQQLFHAVPTVVLQGGRLMETQHS